MTRIDRQKLNAERRARETGHEMRTRRWRRRREPGETVFEKRCLWCGAAIVAREELPKLDPCPVSGSGFRFLEKDPRTGVERS
jgi:hypothetical protein